MKQHYYNLGNFVLPVAPYVGAWIETGSGFYNVTQLHVAPYVGAWIETYWVALSWRP